MNELRTSSDGIRVGVTMLVSAYAPGVGLIQDAGLKLRKDGYEEP